MKKCINFYNQLEEKLLIGSLIFSTGLIFFQIIMRSVFNSSLSWSEELSRYIFIWQIWLGTSIALRDDRHINVDIALKAFRSEKAKEFIRLIGLVLWFLFSIFLLYNGALLTRSMMLRNTLSSGMRLPLYLIYVALPFSSLMVTLRLCGSIKNSIAKIFAPREEQF